MTVVEIGGRLHEFTGIYEVKLTDYQENPEELDN
jgi:hypothetical protein